MPKGFRDWRTRLGNTPRNPARGRGLALHPTWAPLSVLLCHCWRLKFEPKEPQRSQAQPLPNCADALFTVPAGMRGCRVTIAPSLRWYTACTANLRQQVALAASLRRFAARIYGSSLWVQFLNSSSQSHPNNSTCLVMSSVGKQVIVVLELFWTSLQPRGQCVTTSAPPEWSTLQP